MIFFSIYYAVWIINKIMYVICVRVSIFVKFHSHVPACNALRVANGSELLVKILKGLGRNLALPVSGNPGQQPEKEKKADDQYRQKERLYRWLSWQGELETFFLGADREAFQAADTFTVAHGLSGGDLDGCRAD